MIKKGHRRIYSRTLQVVIILFAALQLQAQKNLQQHWVDSVYHALTPAQRIGQLMMVRANSNADSTEIRQISSWIRKYNLGGLCFFKGGPVRQAILTNYYQSLASTPLLIAMDAEWGLGMRLDSTISFARQMTLGAMADESQIYYYGIEIARQLRRLGVHVNFAPVADINNNPDNPVINVRSFGESKEAVARKAVLYMKGLQNGGIQAVAKHFPGHGDTDLDSHYSLPVIQHNKSQIDTIELYPFRELVREGADGIMVAHLNIPALDTSSRRPAITSSIIVDSLLRGALGFQGLIYTDALDMKAASQYSDPAVLSLLALNAGNDVLLLPEQVDSTVSTLELAFRAGLLPEYRLERHCKMVLAAKYRAGLHQYAPIEQASLYDDLNTPVAQSFNRQLYEKALTVVKNEKDLIPLRQLDTLSIGCITIGYQTPGIFQERMSCYAPITHIYLPRQPSSQQITDVYDKIKSFNLLIIGINNVNPSPQKRFGISQEATALVDSVLKLKPGILTLFTLPYALDLFQNARLAQSILVCYQDNPNTYDAAAQVIFGGLAANGKLPVKTRQFALAEGCHTGTVSRLHYSFPESTGIKSAYLANVDSIVYDGLRLKAYPGCQVLISKGGTVIYSKSFGYHDYSNQLPVLNEDLYDLASITKVAATTLAAMELYDEGKILPDKNLSKYFHPLAKSNKKNLTVAEIMAHQAGLIPFIPFYKKTLEGCQPDKSIYQKVISDKFPFRVADSMFIINTYPGYIIDSIVNSPVSPVHEYKYSDLGFILMQQAIEHLSGTTLDKYVEKNFYQPLALPTLGFHPLDRFPLSRIPPTEKDTLFRHQTVQGYVHDPVAAMMGGVAGHAGLFGTANDLAIIFQMLMNDGVYGGKRYLDSATIALFTSQQFTGNRRGLGFDKPQLSRFSEGPACPDASIRSFGHTGFTGTYVWADPDEDLMIVFLSNRVHPDAGNNKLVQLGIRTRIQQAVYDAIRKSDHEKSPVSVEPFEKY